MVQPARDALVHRKGNSLTGRNTQHTGCDTLVEGPPALVLEDRAVHVLETSPARETLGVGGLLDAGLDNIDRIVNKGTHSTGDAANDGGLVAGQLLEVLGALEVALEEVVSGEVGGLVTGLAQGSESDTTVEGAETFLANDGEGAVGSVAVLGQVERVGHGVALGLETDLDDVHGGHDEDSLGHTSEETS